jgi:uncharacterized protein YndB with AHSA1/START domain
VASVRCEIVITAPPELVWDVLRDVGAVHQRLLPGRVIATRIEGDQRFLTFPDGHVVRELIVTVDDDAQRLAYSVVQGARPPARYHHASFEVRPEGAHGPADLDHRRAAARSGRRDTHPHGTRRDRDEGSNRGGRRDRLTPIANQISFMATDTS